MATSELTGPWSQQKPVQSSLEIQEFAHFTLTQVALIFSNLDITANSLDLRAQVVIYGGGVITPSIGSSR